MSSLIYSRGPHENDHKSTYSLIYPINIYWVQPHSFLLVGPAPEGYGGEPDI